MLQELQSNSNRRGSEITDFQAVWYPVRLYTVYDVYARGKAFWFVKIFTDILRKVVAKYYVKGKLERIVC